MNYRRMYAALRKMIADLRSEKVLAAVVWDAIQTVIIPKLQARMLQEKDLTRQRNLQELIDLYEEASDTHSPAALKYGEVASSAIEHQAYTVWGQGRQEAEDAAEEFIGNFYTNENWKRSFETFEPENGPGNLVAYWKTMIGRRSRDFFRKMNTSQKHFVKPRFNDEGIEQDPFGGISSPPTPDFDEPTIEEQVKRLVRYVIDNAKKLGYKAKYVPDLVKLWARHGAEGKLSSNFSELRQLYKKRGLPEPGESVLQGSQAIFLKLAADFFRLEKQGISHRERQELGRAAVDRLAIERFHQLLACWVLGE